MRVLLISNQHPGKDGIGNPIMFRMLKALKQDSRIENVIFFPFTNSIKTLFEIRKKAKEFDIVHIHFGGLYAFAIGIFIIGLKCRKFITFHGTDIHAKALKTTTSRKEKLKIALNQKASFLSIALFDKCGFVSPKMIDYIPCYLNSQMRKKSFIQHLGVDYSIFKLTDKKIAKQYLDLNENIKYVLFSDVSNTCIKRRDIAQSIVERLGNEYQLLIMCGKKPDDVPYYISACDFLLLTSDEEGSPNIIRETLSLNKPVFSVDVGDAAIQLSNLNNSAIISRNPDTAASTILDTIKQPYTDNTRLSHREILDLSIVNAKIVDIYIDSMN